MRRLVPCFLLLVFGAGEAAAVDYVRELGAEANDQVSLKFREQNVDSVDLMGATPNVSVVSNIQVASGRFPSDFDDRRRAAVVFIGNDITETLPTPRHLDPRGHALYLPTQGS